MQHAVDAVGGAEAIALEEGVKVEGLVVPFVREIDGDLTGGAGDRGSEKSGTEGVRVDEKEKHVSGGTTINISVEDDGEETIGNRHRSY